MKPLLAWSDVVKKYNAMTGEKIDESSARAIASAALEKLRKRLTNEGHTEESYR
jgi:hypothetical protein